MTTIQDLIDTDNLVLWHDYRNGTALDQSTNDPELTENDGTLTDTTWTGNSLTFPETTSVVTVADSDDIQLTAGCLMIFTYNRITGQSNTEALFAKLDQQTPAAAAYALTNAHRRRVLFKINLRELYHLSRLRLDEHAQWDIRRLSTEMVRLAQTKFPLALMLAAGKSGFAEVHRRESAG